MEQIDGRAWNMLTEEEQTSLGLQFSYNKSTWEAGEIMGKAHYKYLEIKQRAEKFLKLFSEHFQEFDNLIPCPELVTTDFIEYLSMVVSKRMPLKEGTAKMKSDIYKSPKNREKVLCEDLDKLINSKDVGAKRLVSLILEFDRWNNYRIIPSKYQLPSAYKRRNKNRYKKNIKTMVALNELTIKLLKKKFKGNKLYLPLVYDIYTKNTIIEVSDNIELVEQLSNFGFYIFQKKETCEKYIELIESYNIYTSKSCKDGQVFWPKYRLIIKTAINYFKVEKIPNNKRFLDEFITPNTLPDSKRVAMQENSKDIDKE